MPQYSALNPTIALSRKQLAQASGLMALEVIAKVQSKVVQACKDAGWGDQVWLLAGSDFAEMAMAKGVQACCKAPEYINLRSRPDRHSFLEASTFISLMNFLLQRVPLEIRPTVFYGLTSLYDKA